jgi:tetratricopeptide (TPR) repeat protein
MRDQLAASGLNDQGRARADAGDWESALALYRQAVERSASYGPAWFNMGLIHKQRREWDQALACNERAASLGNGEPGDPAWWNLGIAATALRRWEVAREAWRRFGIEMPDGDGEVRADFGPAPVRLNPDQGGEVVWGSRIDPARIVIANVPFPESGHRWGDIVLHDGAPNGERTVAGRTFGVFDELERWQPSDVPTLEVQVSAPGEDDLQALTDAFDQAGFAAQDWSASVRFICKQCSEGKPPESHGHPAPPLAGHRRFGVAAPPDQAASLLRAWASAGPGRGYAAPAEVG